MSEWIDIRDQKPKEGQEVFYYFDVFHCVYRGKYARIQWPVELTGEDDPIYGDQFYGDSGFLTDDVLLWMPDNGGEIPKPPFNDYIDDVIVNGRPVKIADYE